MASAETDMQVVQSCLNHFGTHPFDAKNPSFFTISTKVKVLGIGDETVDYNKTDKPQLILVKSNVTVLSKNLLRLMNPNGWYCLKGQVAVLGKAEIHLSCKAKIASSKDGTTVLGGNDANNGVIVLGSSRIIREGCEAPKAP